MKNDKNLRGGARFKIVLDKVPKRAKFEYYGIDLQYDVDLHEEVKEMLEALEEFDNSQIHYSTSTSA